MVKSKYGGFGSLEKGVREGRGVVSRSGGRAQKKSGWWSDVCNLYWGQNGEGLCCEFVKTVGSGESTSFWVESWVGGESSKFRFNHLYMIIVQKESRDGECGYWDQNGCA